MSNIVGLQTSIWQNRMRSIFLLLLFPIFLFGLTRLTFAFIAMKSGNTLAESFISGLQVTGGYFVFFGPIILIWGIISFIFHRQIIFKFAGAKPITRKENPEIYNIVENLCISRGLTPPQVGIIEDESMNAFATGWNTKNSWIVFSRGILNRLNRQEIEAVAAHELTHIINKDSLMMIIIIVFIGAIGTLGEILIRFRSRSDDDSKSSGGIIIVGLIFCILGYMIFPLVKLAISRKREYLADAGSVELTKDKLSMISALKKISEDSQIESIKKSTVAAMCIANPFGKGGFFSNLLSTHPTIEDRIKTLEIY